MLTLKKFRGVNNVAPSELLDFNELTVANNVDISATGSIVSRKAYELIQSGHFRNLFATSSFILATKEADLVAVTDTSYTVLSAAFGCSRVWFCVLPDNKVLCSNGYQAVITDGVVAQEFTTPPPPSAGYWSEVTGGLPPGQYRYAVTQVRSDGRLESPPVFSEPVNIAVGGITIFGIAPSSGCVLRLYLTADRGETFYFAAQSDSSGLLTYTSDGSDLSVPLRTADLITMPVGIMPTIWRTRLVNAVGDTLWASVPFSFTLCDPVSGYKRFTSEITGIGATNSGLYVGTKEALYFLMGDQFERLTLKVSTKRPVLEGSMVECDANLIDARRSGKAVICVAGGYVVYGFEDGEVEEATLGRYLISAEKSWSCIRINGDVAQYVLIPK